MPSSLDIKRSTILFVDDSVLVLAGLSHLVDDFANVHLAETSEEAIEFLSRSLPDLIVSDISRPGMNGLDFLDTVRRDPRTRHIPFMFLTTHRGEEVQRRALMQGCDEFISKAESGTFLIFRIQRILERSAPLHKGIVLPVFAEPLRVFICYAKEDAAYARKIWSLATRNGVNAWPDEKMLLPGQEWDAEIRRALRTSHLVIVCLSNHSISKSGYVQKEIRMVLDLADEQPPEANFIVPIRVEHCTVPERLAKWQWLDFFGLNARDKLLGALAARANKLGMLPPVSALKTKR